MPHRWDDCASLRREQIESGLDLTFNKVFLPWYRAFIQNQQVSTVLEVGAGTGHLALAMSGFVDEYTAAEPSGGMHRVAADVLHDSSVLLRQARVEELEIDRYYDVVLSHLCLHTIDDFEGFLECMSRHVAPSGTLLFSIPHPCFYNEYKQLIPADEYAYMTDSHREVSFSITLDPDRPITDVPYFHRPLSKYVRAVVSCGFVIIGVEEVFPSRSIQELYGADWDTPRYLIVMSKRNRQ